MALVEEIIARNSDVEVLVTVDDRDSEVRGGNLEETYHRFKGLRVNKKGGDDWLVQVHQDRVSKLNIDSGRLARGFTDESGLFDLTRFLDDLDVRVARKTPKPSPTGSVGAGTHELTVETSATSINSGSFTPSNNVIVVSIGEGANAVAGPTGISDTFADTITWVKHTDSQNGRAGNYVYVGTGWVSGAGVVTVTFAANSKLTMVVDTYSGVDTTTPVSETNTGSGSASTLSISLVGIDTNNRSVGSVTSRQGTGTTPGTNETEMGEVTNPAGGNRCRTQSQRGTNLAQDTPVDWSTLATLNNAGGALELAEAAAGEGAEEMHMRRRLAYARP